MNDHADPAQFHEATVGTRDAAVQSLLRFARLLNRRRSIVLYSLAVTALMGAIYYGTATRVYTATGAVLVRQTGGDLNDVGFSADRSTYDQMATFQQLFTSAVVVKGALKNMKQLPPEISHDLSKEAAVGRLKEMLHAKTLRRTSIIELTAHSEDPAAAARVVDAMVKAYLDYIDDNHRSVSAEVITLLKEGRMKVEFRLNEKEQELLAAKRSCADFGLSEHKNVVHPLVQNVISLNEVVAETRQRRIELDTSLAALRNTNRSGGDLRQHLVTLEPMLGKEIFLDAVGMNSADIALMRDTEQRLRVNRTRLSAIAEHYGPAHPEVVELSQLISSEQEYLDSVRHNMESKVSGMQSEKLGRMLVNLLEEDLVRTWAKERELVQQYGAAEAKAIELNDSVAAVSIIDRNVQMLRKVQEAVVNQIENIDINQNNVDVRVSIVTQPVKAEDPISPNLMRTGLVCLCFGFAIGTAIVYTLDVIDDRFQSPEELQECLGARVLAMIRRHEPLVGVGAAALQVNIAPDAVESEAFRTLRTTLAFNDDECHRIVVTSSEPSDGKTTVLSNLGASYAQAGKRTLLIDCDLRRPGLTALFDMRGQLGVSEILRSDDELDALALECVQATGVDGMDVIPSGRRPPDSAELLGRDRFAEFIAWAETIYDQVLVDTSPMLAATDAAIASRAVDGMLIVVRPEKNSRRVVMRAHEEVVSLGVNVLGLVVNAVDQESGGGYYGYGGYGYGYGYGTEYGGSGEDEEIDIDGVVRFPGTVAQQDSRAEPASSFNGYHRNAG